MYRCELTPRTGGTRGKKKGVNLCELAIRTNAFDACRELTYFMNIPIALARTTRERNFLNFLNVRFSTVNGHSGTCGKYSLLWRSWCV